MSETQLTKKTVMPIQARTYTPEQITLIKNTFAVGATNDELQLFIFVAEKLGLDILSRQIHFVKRPRWNPKTNREEEIAAFQVGIDGYVSLAQRLKGDKGTPWENQTLLDGYKTEVIEKDGKVIGAKATVWRKDFSHPIEVSIDTEEYIVKTKDGRATRMWEKRKMMSEKCVLALGLRRTVPTILSGVFIPEEMGDEETTAPDEIEKREPARIVQSASPPPKSTDEIRTPIPPSQVGDNYTPGDTPLPSEPKPDSWYIVQKDVKPVKFISSVTGEIEETKPYKTNDVINLGQLEESIELLWVKNGVLRLIKQDAKAPPKTEDKAKEQAESSKPTKTWTPLKTSKGEYGSLNVLEDGAEIVFTPPIANPDHPTMRSLYRSVLDKYANDDPDFYHSDDIKEGQLLSIRMFYKPGKLTDKDLEKIARYAGWAAEKTWQSATPATTSSAKPTSISTPAQKKAEKTDEETEKTDEEEADLEFHSER